ncbi:MAG: hypothetical protein ACFFG0_52010 [Candidatus Thorarchaeota archaeon]
MAKNNDDEINREMGKLLVRAILMGGKTIANAELESELKKPTNKRDPEKITTLRLANIFGNGIEGIMDIIDDIDEFNRKKKKK